MAKQIFRACSSLFYVVGESQILGQVKQAWELAKKYGFLNYTMEFVFQKAQKNTHTYKNSFASSIGSAAVDLVNSIFDSPRQKSSSYWSW